MLCSGALSQFWRLFSYGILVVLLLHWVYGGIITLLLFLLALGGLLYYVQVVWRANFRTIDYMFSQTTRLEFQEAKLR